MEHHLPLFRLRHPPVPRAPRKAIPPLAVAAGCVGGKIRRTRRRSKKFYPSPKGQLLAIRTNHFFKLKLRMILRKTRYLTLHPICLFSATFFAWFFEIIFSTFFCIFVFFARILKSDVHFLLFCLHFFLFCLNFEVHESCDMGCNCFCSNCEHSEYAFFRNARKMIKKSCGLFTAK